MTIFDFKTAMISKPWSSVTWIYPTHKIYTFGRDNLNSLLHFTWNEIQNNTGTVSVQIQELTGTITISNTVWQHVAVSYR